MNKQIIVDNNAAKRMHIYGALVIMLGILALLAPGITGVSVAMVVGFLVMAGDGCCFLGLFRFCWAL